jgi:hypothetical protein
MGVCDGRTQEYRAPVFRSRVVLTRGKALIWPTATSKPGAAEHDEPPLQQTEKKKKKKEKDAKKTTPPCCGRARATAN